MYCVDGDGEVRGAVKRCAIWDNMDAENVVVMCWLGGMVRVCVCGFALLLVFLQSSRVSLAKNGSGICRVALITYLNDVFCI
jgi:hypothetical protein